MEKDKVRDEETGAETVTSGAQQQTSECCDAVMKSACGPMIESMMKKFCGAAEAPDQDRSGSSAFEMPSCCKPMVEQMFGDKTKPTADNGEAPQKKENTPQGC